MARRLHPSAQMRVETIASDATVAQAIRQMSLMGVRHLPIMNDAQMVGVVSESDLLAHRVEGVLPISEVMSRPVVTAQPGEPFDVLEDRMVQRRIGCLPVVDAGRLVDIVTRTDLLAHASQRALEGTALGKMKVRDIMEPEPWSTREDELLLDAVGRMAQMGTEPVPVVDREGRFQGMLTGRDLRRALGSALGGAWRRVSTTRVGEAMSTPIASVGQTLTLLEALPTLLAHRSGAVAVTDAAGRLVGVVSSAGLLRTLLC